MKKFWQWLGLHVHDWDKWETEKYEVTAVYGGIPIDGTKREITCQDRVCKTCGYRQSRRF